MAIPFVLAVVAAISLGRRLPTPETWAEALWAWVILSAASTAVLLGTDRVARRLLPLSALLRLSLVFPDQAPSRYRVARSTATTRQLEAEVEAARNASSTDERTEAAERVLRLVAALATHDRATRGHAERVRIFTDMIAEEYELEPHEVDRLRWAALLHDVGKLTVHHEILNKPGAPDEDEWETLRRHPLEGARITAPLRDWLGPWALAIEQHHEQWDGSGYPFALAGTDISLAARIVAVADAYDVMTSARSYKRAMTAVEARRELARCAGHQFDPAVVRAFLAISLGRLRWAVGPFTWLANVPVVRPLTRIPSLGTLASAFAAVAAGLATYGAPALQPAPVREVPVALVDADDTPAPTETGSAPRETAEPSVGPTPTPTSPAQRPSALPAETPTPPSTTPPVAPVASVAPSTSTPTTSEETEPDPVPPSPTPAPEPTVHPTPEPTQEPTPASTTNRPLTTRDTAVTPEDTTVVVDVLANDADADDDVLRLVGATATSGGVASPSGDRVRFVPFPDWNGTATVTYVVTDGSYESTGELVVDVLPVDDPPVAVEDVAATPEDTSVRVDLVANDVDVDGDVLTVVALDTTGVTTSTVVDHGDGTVEVVPDADASGTDVLTYVVSDGTSTAVATATVTILPVPDAPVAADDAYATSQDTTLVVDAAGGVLANDGDEDGDVLTVTGLTTSPPATEATVTMEPGGGFTLVPENGFVGTTSFVYEVTDGTFTAGATVTVRVDSALATNGLYLTASPGDGTTSAMSTTAPGDVLGDPDGDGDPGWTIESSSQEEDEDQPEKFHDWLYPVPVDTVLAGPVSLALWSATEDFGANANVDITAFLYTCDGSGSNCSLLTSIVDLHVDGWSGPDGDWGHRTVTLGSVDHTLLAGRTLRLRLLFGHENVWLPLTGTMPSRLVLTTS